MRSTNIEKGEGVVKTCNIGVIGATSLVGELILSILEERGFPVDKLVLMASDSSIGTTVEAFGAKHAVRATSAEVFESLDIAFFATEDSDSEQLAPEAIRRGCVVIDTSSYWRHRLHSQLILSEINGKKLRFHRGLIATPGCTSAILATALAPIHREILITSLEVTCCQSISDAGREGLRQLRKGTRRLVTGGNEAPCSTALAFNVLPTVNSVLDSGTTQEEQKLMTEVPCLLGATANNMLVEATCVRVPTIVGHGLSVTLAFPVAVQPWQIIRLLSGAPGVVVRKELNQWDTPVSCVGKDDVFVSRIRQGSKSNRIQFWLVGDNLRKGAALNAVQIAETLVAEQKVQVVRNLADQLV